MKEIYVFGHKNPDTDSICSAIVYAYLKNELTETNVSYKAVRLGSLNEETKFVLNYFKNDIPIKIDEVPKEIDEVILVDHNEFQQSVSNISDVKVVEVIDHHRINNFATNDPIYYRAEPVGCTSTILLKMFKENDVYIEKKMAGLMLSAIVSDTLLLKSPTCTKQDVLAANLLAEQAEVNLETYGLNMLKAGANLSNKSIRTLLTMDSKEFILKQSKVEIANVNAVDTQELLEKKSELENEMNKVIKEKRLDLFLFTITDILNNDSVVISLGNKAKSVESAFNVTLHDNIATLKGVVSRKKQVVPALTNVLS